MQVRQLDRRQRRRKQTGCGEAMEAGYRLSPRLGTLQQGSLRGVGLFGSDGTGFSGFAQRHHGCIHGVLARYGRVFGLRQPLTQLFHLRANCFTQHVPACFRFSASVRHVASCEWRCCRSSLASA